MERTLAVTALLLAFDGYHRPQDPYTTRSCDLHPPVSANVGAAGKWSLTLFPASRTLRSKTGAQDNTFVIGDTSKRRAWLQQVAAALHQNAKDRVYLYNLAPGQLNRIYNRGATLAKVDEVNLHRLRHGGASADGIEQVPEPTIQSRGFWASVKSVQRYKKPGAYLRELSKLSAAQLATAQALERTLAKRLCIVLLQSSSTSQRVSARGASSVLPRVSTITKGSLSKERLNA